MNFGAVVKQTYGLL